MVDQSKSEKAPLLSSNASYSAIGGNDDDGRQAQDKGSGEHSYGGPSLRGIFLDHTFSAAMMHSVGTLGRDEYVDSRGDIHTITIRRRHRQTVASGAPALSNEKVIPDYGQLQDLFTRESAKKQNIGDIDTMSGLSDKRRFIAKRPKHSGLDDAKDIEEDEEYEVEDQVGGGSITAAIFGIVKGTVGPAILYLPKGFQQAGWACAIPALFVSMFAFIYSAYRLLECWKVEDARQKFLARRMTEIQSMLEKYEKGADKEYSKKKIGNGTQAASSEQDRQIEALNAFKPKLLTYPELARRSFGSSVWLIEFGIASMQYGICLTYLIFVPANLYAIFQSLFGISVPKSFFLIGMLLIEIPCTWIRDIRRLTPFNVTATFLIVYGLSSCLLISFVHSFTEKEETVVESLTSLPAINSSWYMFIGTAFFVFEGNICLIVPLQEAVYKKEDRDRFPAVNQNVTICIVLFYIFFSMVVWTTFGDSVETVLTASLPKGNYVTSVQFAYSIAVILTYPLQAFPAMEVVLQKFNFEKETNTEGAIKNKKFRLGSILYTRNAIVTLLNICLGIIAVIAIDYLGGVVSLLGSLVGMPIALIYPPLMHNILVKDSSSTVTFMNYFVATIGMIATVATSYCTIANWGESS